MFGWSETGVSVEAAEEYVAAHLLHEHLWSFRVRTCPHDYGLPHDNHPVASCAFSRPVFACWCGAVDRERLFPWYS